MAQVSGVYPRVALAAQIPPSSVAVPSIARKPVAAGFQGAMRVVTPPTWIYHQGMLTPPHSPTDGTSNGYGPKDEEFAPTCVHEGTGLLAKRPCPESASPNLPQNTHSTRQRQQSAPEPQRQVESIKHTRSLSFDPSLTSNKAQRHPHEQGKTTGFRTRGTSVRWDLVDHPSNNVCDEESSHAGKWSSSSRGAIAQQGLITPPPSAHGVQTQRTANSSTTEALFLSKPSGSSVPPKACASTAPKAISTRKISMTQATPTPSTATMKPSTEETQTHHGHNSFFYDSDDDNAMQKLRKVATGFRKSRSSNSDVKKSLGRYGDAKTTSRRKWSITERLRQVVLCTRTVDNVGVALPVNV